MFTVRESQSQALEQIALRAFEDEMVGHCFELSPHLCKTLPDEELRLVIRQAIARARTHGFIHRGPVRLYIDLTFFFGKGFDDDPQIPWAEEVLRRDGFTEQMHRAEALYEQCSAYLHEVVGPNGVHARAALQRLVALEDRELSLDRATLVPDALGFLQEIYPQKYAFTGREPLERLVSSAVARAQAIHGFTRPRSILMLVVLMFAFGHRCDEDPLYGWIQRTLTGAVPDREAVAQKLERRAAAWFKAVLATELSAE